MRVGDKVEIGLVDGSRCSGTVVASSAAQVAIENNEVVWWYNRAMIMFVKYANPTVKVFHPLSVLCCLRHGCPGVQFITAKAPEKVSSDDFAKFMQNCNARNGDCEGSVLGEMRGLDSETAKRMFDDMMLGDYPTKEVRDVAEGSEREDAEA